MRKLALAFLLAASVQPAFADTEVVGGIAWTYAVSDGKASVGSGHSYLQAVSQSMTGAIAIPSTLGNCPVTSIGDYAFSGCSGLTSIMIPDSVTGIEWNAFEGCSGLRLITIPNSVTSIGNFAFSGCSGLMSITIPDGVTNIGVYAFQNCTSLRSITIPGSVTNVGYNAFRGCSDLTSISIPESLADHIGSWSLPADCRRFIRPDIVTVDGVPIPGTWLDETARTFVATMEGDFEAAALATAANGVNQVWECYVAGLSPTNAAERFEARVGFENGEPVVTWNPDLGVARDYVVEGKTNLVDRSWGPTNESTRFFRVKVELP